MNAQIVSHQGREFVLARIAVRAEGMTSLDGVRIDARSFRLRDADDWVGYVKEHEGEWGPLGEQPQIRRNPPDLRRISF